MNLDLYRLILIEYHADQFTNRVRWEVLMFFFLVWEVWGKCWFESQLIDENHGFAVITRKKMLKVSINFTIKNLQTWPYICND